MSQCKYTVNKICLNVNIQSIKFQCQYTVNKICLNVNIQSIKYVSM